MSESYPRKKYFRSRAHCNPLSNNDSVSYPVKPSVVDWSSLGGPPDFLDVGCGFGGLAVALGALSPKRTLALEIRPKVCEFVRQRIASLELENVACMRYNAMHLPHLIAKGTLEKIFFCFPDPHFKTKNHRRRIISEALLAEYAFFLKEGGLLYCVTDVQDLHEWHVAKLDAHCLFERVHLEDDFLRAALDTEEGRKVTRNHGHKYHAIYRRIQTPLIVSSG